MRVDGSTGLSLSLADVIAEKRACSASQENILPQACFLFRTESSFIASPGKRLSYHGPETERETDVSRTA